MIKIILFQFIGTALIYFIGIFVGMAVMKQRLSNPNTGYTNFDDDLISHVGYDNAQCGYDK